MRHVNPTRHQVAVLLANTIYRPALQRLVNNGNAEGAQQDWSVLEGLRFVHGPPYLRVTLLTKHAFRKWKLFWLSQIGVSSPTVLPPRFFDDFSRVKFPQKSLFMMD